MDEIADEIAVLSAAECRDLLETDCVGRVSFVAPAGPRIVPVNFVVAEAAILWRTTASSEVALYAPGAEVCFEIDNLDGERRRGWSVVAHGVCERVDDVWPDQVRPRVPRQGPQPWAGGVRRVVLRLPWRELTGRRVGGVHWPHPVVSHRARPY